MVKNRREKFALFPPAVNIRQPMLAGASLIEGAS